METGSGPGPRVNCENCPSFLGSTDAVTKFRKSIGAPMCGRFGIPLARPGVSGRVGGRVRGHIAEHCGAFGLELPITPLEYRFQVALPMPELLDRTVSFNQRDACNSCASCVHFVRDDVVARELGWAAGLCAVKGKLILTNRQVIEARNCEFREYGPIRQSTNGVHLLPEYESDFGEFDPIKAFFANREVQVEPTEYETDRPVSTEESEAGIRAWRAVKDPERDTIAYLPIYRGDFFDDAERELIPNSGDDEHPEMYVDHFGGVYLAAVCWTELDETPALTGEAGTGKTELFRHLAWLMQLPFRRVSITGSTELDDLAGKMHYSPDKGTYFQYGRLPYAWMRPGVICLDEPNTGAPDVWQFLRPLTDNSKQLVLDMNSGETISRHTDCYMGMTMNPSWDPKNVGAMQISDADANRLFHIFLETPPPQLEREIIAARVKLDGWEIDDKRLAMVMSIAVELRALVKDGTLPISWAIRPQIKVARALRWFDTVTAYRRAIGDYLEPEAQQALLDVVRAHADAANTTPRSRGVSSGTYSSTDVPF